MAYRAPIGLSPYSARWPRMFAGESRCLRSAFPAAAFRIEHVGSTAVFGLAAKPIVDMLIGATSLAEIERRIAAVENLGYRYVPEYEATLPLRRFFAKPAMPPRRFHIHAVEIGSTFWIEQLLFRDALRADAGLAAEYGALKLELATRFGDDRESYTDAKAPFIRGVLDRGRSIGGSDVA